jgi:PAS domain S-box-containing protein
LSKSDSLKDSSKKLKKSVRLQEPSQEIEDRHQDLLGHIKAVQYTHDLQGQLLSVNQETTEFLGYDKNSLLNMNIRNLLAPEVRHEFDTYLTEMKRQGNAKGSMLVQTATGEKRVLIYNNTLQTEGVATPTVQGIAYDITKYIQTERALRQVSGQLSIVLESLPIVCYIRKAEKDYGATYITHNIKAITGFEDTNFTSKSSFWADRIHPEDAPRIFANLPQIFEKGYHEHQYRWQVADGSYKWFYDYMRVIISSNGKKCIIGMMQDITERKRAEEALLSAAQQWRTTFDGISDIVCLLDPEGKILKCNKAFTNFLGKPFSEILNRSYWEIIYGTAAPIKESPILRMLETRCRETVILPINDRWFNIAVDPLLDEAGSLIGGVYIMSDITEQKRAEEAAKRLSQENAIVAEIGRIISSTLNIEEVYERFAEETHKLIPFDRIMINLTNLKNNTSITAYIAGVDVPDQRPGNITPLTGTATEEVIRTRSSLLIQGDNIDEAASRFPRLLPTFRAGFRSLIFVPLISKDQVIGVLSLRSLVPKAYTDRDVNLAESIGNQIASAIVNAQLFIERKRAEEAVNRLAQENAIIAEIGRIISSTLNIEEVYERFVEEVHKLIPFDRIALTTMNPDHRSGTMAYAFGVEVKDRNQGAVFPLTGSFYEEIFSKQSGILVQTEDESELVERYPILLSTFRAGLLSMISVPLISKGEVIGVLHIRSLKPNAYTELDLKLAEKVGNQIAGAIANAQLFTERKQAEEALRTEIQKFQTVSENAPFGMAMTDQTGTFKYINPKFKELFGYDLSDIPDGKTWFRKAFPDPAYRHQVISTWIDDIGSQKPGEKIIRIFRVICKDGTGKISEFSPVKLETGEYLTSFVDITHRKEAEEALRRSEEAARRLAQENATMAEIGRIISSTLNINEVYERFVEEVRKFIQFDRITINHINPKENTFVVLYNAGLDMADREVGKAVPLTGTATEWVMQNRSTLLILEENREEMLGRIPGLLPIFKAGFRSMMLIPLTSKDQVIGTLALQTAKQNAYTEVDLKLAERISNQIAGAIANAQLFIERKRTEESLQKSEEEAKRLAQENATVAEIGRIISSTLNIEEVYERFAEEVRKLIPLDRIALTTINPDHRSGTIAYVLGVEVEDRNQGAVFPLTGSFYEEIFSKRSGILVQTEDESELVERYPILLSTFRAGLLSMISVPLISKGEVIGVLHIRSLKPNVYTELDLKLAESIGNQIAGAIANAQLFVERKRAEESLQKSEEEAKRLAQENAIIAEIGRIISSSLNIDEVYEHFAEEVRKLILFDRIVINFIDIEKGTVVNVYMAGKGIVDRRVAEILTLKGSGNAEMVRTKSTFLIQTEDFNEYKDRFPMLLSTFQSGFRSIMNVPLFSKGQIIGGLLLRSFMPYAYSDKDVRLAERIGTQIAGAIANAQLFNERLRAEEKMKALEDQLRQSQKMEAVGRLAGGVAHDFNNLLTVIKGYGQISLAILKEGDPLKENIEEIQKAADRAASLTKQLLVFSRRQILELKVFHLNTILQDLYKMLHRIIGEDIELVYSLSNDLGQVKTDPTQMEQVILNLAINAKDAMPSGGKLTIETSNATLDESYTDSHIGVTPGDYVMLSVSDTGVGMTPEIKERIFEPFFTTKEKGKGTGLGLSIVYGIVQQSGGSIWVYSELGLGTTFKVFLPRIEEDAESLRPNAVPTKSLQGSETILVVEDEEIVRKLACKILEKNGYRVLEASNGEEALYIVQKQNGNPIHLVVTDVVMPGLSGRQLVDRLVSLWPQTKALYMSGYTNDAIAHHGVLDPGIAYIQKPFTPDDLIFKVRKVLDGP